MRRNDRSPSPECAECKKYSNATSLSNRELLGEIDEAIKRDPALEAWILVATREVPEQIAQALSQKGEQLGVPVVIIDWPEHGVSRLAALFTSAPDIVDEHYSQTAALHARKMRAACRDATTALQRQLQSWCLGFEALRNRSHELLLSIWTSPREAQSRFGQNAAGGAQPHRIRRTTVHDGLEQWWHTAAHRDSPAILFGTDGVGKTWCAFDWLIADLARQPIVIVVPASTAASLSGAICETALKRFLGERLYELTGVRDPAHWTARLDYLLQRPAEEGPVLTVLFDGMNQEPSLDWLRLFKVLQGMPFSERARVVASTRRHHFDDRLGHLRGLVEPVSGVLVDRYDATAGGELDQMLQFEKLTRNDLHPDLLEIARTPRLFRLAVSFRKQLVDGGRVTVHRLLWEYGRDSFGERAGRSFSEQEWREWLAEMARQLREGVRQFSVKSLSNSAARDYLDHSEIYRRLSDIIDGRFVERDPGGALSLVPMMVAHSLGAALLSTLDRQVPRDVDAAGGAISKWIDPISGFDQRAEILRAAVSIALQKGDAAAVCTSALLIAWLQTQNLTDEHRREIEGLAAEMPEALLDAVERSDSKAQQSAQLWAIRALGRVPRTDNRTLRAIIERGRCWLSIVSRDVEDRRAGDETWEEERSRQFTKRIGRDVSAPVTVLGVELHLVDRDYRTFLGLLPTLLRGFPLATAMPCIEVAAIARAIRGRLEYWPAFEWLCLLNEADPDEMRSALRTLAADIKNRCPEPGVHVQLPALVATSLLWISGEEDDEEAAIALDPGLNRVWDYEKDYLSKPARSFFALEHRHALDTLGENEVALLARIDRVSQFLLDPGLLPPMSFVAELESFAATFPVEKVHEGRGATREQHWLERLRPPLARWCPAALADLERKILCSAASMPPDRRYMAAVHSTDAFLVHGPAEAEAAKTLRAAGKERDATNEGFGAGRLLMVEIRDLPSREQIDRVVEAGLPFIVEEFSDVIQPPLTDDVDYLIRRWGQGSEQQRHDLIIALSCHSSGLGGSAWDWLIERALMSAHKLKGLVFQMLNAADGLRFGRTLLDRNWRWDGKAHLWENHYGSEAIISSGAAVPFEELALAIAPWLLLSAVRTRGNDVAEARLACEIVSHIVMSERVATPDTGADLTIEVDASVRRPLNVWPEPRTDRRAAAILPGNNELNASIDAYRRAIEVATQRINAARASGASLYLTELSSADMAILLQHCPDVAEQWLAGCEGRTSDFQRRVRLAEMVFLALCEALLVRDQERGVELWHALNETLLARYRGTGQIDEMVHMVFRAPAAPQIIELRDTLLRLENCHDDRRLYEIAIAAISNGCADWLGDVISRDGQSPHLWRRRRAETLSGFACGSALPAAEDWPEGLQRTTTQRLRNRAAQRRFSDAVAHHWWQAYLDAGSADEAYAAWTLFLASADRRAHVWMKKEFESRDKTIALFDLKRAHMRLNRSEMEKILKQGDEKWARTFLDEDTVASLPPWSGLAQFG